jgi:hypothetical protein
MSESLPELRLFRDGLEHLICHFNFVFGDVGKVSDFLRLTTVNSTVLVIEVEDLSGLCSFACSRIGEACRRSLLIKVHCARSASF